ncbi:alpha/beta hydrolase [Pedobacter miscanthi]|uniref:alpha/beta hydrolase n=1 Tax=Pedobacter miscanthi TaxID=2259170 RepID=UPI00292E6212|nr:alpha/beta hydrolase [Pedobacter miscanthi]
MKKILLYFLFSLALIQADAQIAYTMASDIPYYENTNTADSYRNEKCRLDIYYPSTFNNFPLVIWFHGGSLTGGKKDIPKALLEKGFAVVSVDYRLSPKVTAPAYIEDAAAAVAWVFKNIKRYGGNPDQIILSGHSAGAYLGLMITLDKSYLGKYGIEPDRIAELVPLSPQAITHFTVRSENGISNLQPTIDKYAPLFFVRPDAPKMLLITGDREIELLGRYEENAYLQRMFKLSGHKQCRLLELQGFNHGTMVEPGLALLIEEVNKMKSMKKMDH